MFEWNHNTCYHKYLMSKIPATNDTALDVGSGLGLFSSKLSSRFIQVISIEPDKESIAFSKFKYDSLNNITYIENTFLDHDFKNKKYDYISAIASIHHMDYYDALKKMKSLVSPSGRIAILGLYRESTVIDILLSLIAILPNFILNLISKKSKENNYEMIVTAPTMSIKEIKIAANQVLGNFQFKRHLFWRYSLIYKSDYNLTNPLSENY